MTVLSYITLVLYLSTAEVGGRPGDDTRGWEVWCAYQMVARIPVSRVGLDWT